MTLQKAVESMKNHDEQSEQAFQFIYKETYQTALAVIKRYCDAPGDYEYLLQETYIQVYQFIGTLNDGTKALAWIEVIAGNTAIRHNMKKWPAMFSDLDGGEGKSSDFEAGSGTFHLEKIADRKAVSAAVTQILDSLPYDQRAALWMVYGQQVTIREMAVNLGISENAIRSRLYRGRQKLMERKADFRKYGIELTAIPVSMLVAMAFRDTVYAAGSAGYAAGTTAGTTAGAAPDHHSFADRSKKTGVKKRAVVAGAVIAGVAGAGIAAAAAGKVAFNHTNASYMEPIEEKIEAFNDRTYGMKTELGVYYPDEALKQIEVLLKNSDDYTTQDYYQQWENETSYQSVLFQQACSDYDARFGDDWKITYKKQEANKLPKDKVKKLNRTYQDPYSVYPQSMLPAIYTGYSDEERELENWFEEHEVKEAYEVTLDMKIKGSKGRGEAKAEAIVANYGGDWLLYAAGSPDDLVYSISFREVNGSEGEEKDKNKDKEKAEAEEAFGSSMAENNGALDYANETNRKAVDVPSAVTAEADSEKPKEEKKAARITSERINVDETYYKIVFTAVTEAGEPLWEYVSEENISAELDSVGLFDIHKDKVYLYDNGSILVLDCRTGNEVWRNKEFSGGEASYVFDAKDNLYVCGFYGPDIMKVDSSGKTIYRIQTLKDKYYWPYQLDYIEHDNTVAITFDGNDSGSGVNTLVLDAETGEVISDHESNEGNLSGKGNGAFGMETGNFMYVVNCKQSITLRTQPSTSASEICQIPLYGAVIYHGMAENGFYEVSYLGNRGYALAEYLDMYEPQI